MQRKRHRSKITSPTELEESKLCYKEMYSFIAHLIINYKIIGVEPNFDIKYGESTVRHVFPEIPVFVEFRN